MVKKIKREYLCFAKINSVTNRSFIVGNVILFCDNNFAPNFYIVPDFVCVCVCVIFVLFVLSINVDQLI